MTIWRPKSIPAEVLTRGEVMDILKKADCNVDGNLDIKELEKALEKIGSNWPQYRAWRCKKNADTDGGRKINLSTEIEPLISYVMKWYEGKI